MNYKKVGGVTICLISTLFVPAPVRFVIAHPHTNNKHSRVRLGAPVIRISKAFLKLWLRRFLVNSGCAFIVKSLRTASCRLTLVNGFGILLLACIMVPRPKKHGCCFNVARKRPLKLNATFSLGLRVPATQAHQRTPAQIVTLTDRCIQNGRANGPTTSIMRCFGFSIPSNGFMRWMLWNRSVTLVDLSFHFN